MTLDPVNVIACIATVLSTVLSIWIYVESKRKRDVEDERLAALRSRMEALLRVLVAARGQAALIGEVSERDETTKKELKHLAVAAVGTLDAAVRTISEEQAALGTVRFGVPRRYATVLDREAPAGALKPGAGTHEE